MKMNIHTPRLKSLILVAGLAGLTACTPEASFQFYREAGSVIDRGNFGNAW